MRIVLLSLGLSVIFACGSEAEADTWKSADGRTLEATGLYWTAEGVQMRRASDEKEFVVPFDSLSTADVIRAVEALPFQCNDQISLRARTVKAEREKRARETGNLIVTVTEYSYNGYVWEEVDVRPEIDRYKVSHRLVEVELSSTFGPGYAGLEFFTIAGKGAEKQIFDAEYQVVRFEKSGSVKEFRCNEVEDFEGWVVVARSPNTGKIVGVTGSMKHLEDFVVGKLPEKAIIKSDHQGLRNKIIAAAKSRE
ncbi:hypothetical protein [Haloferula sp. A504]|uniref:hypothetical protein n=1 Tax=Haloferula sp. A504 TaxID=3373601 RepID=UPI0031C07113|nr:hypothetical protein [Verrucomicrobiaceae bacterium E54]